MSSDVFPDHAEGFSPNPEAALARPARKGGNLYLLASLFSQAVALLRYVVLARVLGPEQLGLAATLIVTASFFDLISDTGADRFIIQDREGGTVAVQKLVQLVYASRGAAIAVALLIFAIPLSALYREPRLAAGFAFLALSPLIRGFLHLDVRRVQRNFDFRSDAKSWLAAEAAGLIATLVAAWLTHDFTAIVWGIVTRGVVVVIVTHVLAERPYAFGWDRLDAPRLMRFSIPLMFSGLMLFIGSQGDRVVVADWLGARTLGLYSATLLLIYFPSALVQGFIHTIYVPMVAAERDHPRRREQVIELLGGQTLLLALAMCAGFALVAPVAVTVLYGHRYTQSALLVALIGILQATRFLTNWPTTVNLSLGRSHAVLAGNVARFLAYPGAFAGVKLIGGLNGLAAGFAVGEMVSIVVSVVLMNRAAGRPWLGGFDRLAAFILTCWLIVGWNLALEHGTVLIEVALAVASVGLAVWIARRETVAIKNAAELAVRTASTLFARLKAPR